MDKKTERHIINVLRAGTITWEGRRNALERARKKVDEGKVRKDGTKVLKYYWQCAICKVWFRDQSDLEVDHIVEIGPFNGNWDDYVRRMYCDESNLQACCQVCHRKKSTSNASLRFARKSVAP